MSDPIGRSAISFVEASRMALDEALGDDESVVLLGEDIGDKQGGGVFKVTSGLSTKYGEQRVRTTPISEQAIVGAAIGAAIAGLRPVAEIMLMNFTAVAMDQLVNHAAKIRFMSGGQTTVPLTIRTATGAGVGFGGQHSDMLEAWFAHTAGMKVVVPSTPAEAKGLLLSCIFDDDPCIFIENTSTLQVKGERPAPGLRIPLSKANVVRTGGDVSLICYGRAVADSLAAAESLAEQGVSAEVVDLRTVSPMDTETILKSVAKTRRAVVVHEAVMSFGVGAEIASRIQEALFDQLEAPVYRVASKDAPVPFSSALERAFLYSREEIAAAVRKSLGQSVRAARART